MPNENPTTKAEQLNNAANSGNDKLPDTKKEAQTGEQLKNDVPVTEDASKTNPETSTSSEEKETNAEVITTTPKTPEEADAEIKAANANITEHIEDPDDDPKKGPHKEEPTQEDLTDKFKEAFGYPEVEYKNTGSNNFGRQDEFVELASTGSVSSGRIERSLAHEIAGIGCIVRYQTHIFERKTSGLVSESVVFVPGVSIIDLYEDWENPDVISGRTIAKR